MLDPQRCLTTDPERLVEHFERRRGHWRRPVVGGPLQQHVGHALVDGDAAPPLQVLRLRRELDELRGALDG